MKHLESKDHQILAQLSKSFFFFHQVLYHLFSTNPNNTIPVFRSAQYAFHCLCRQSSNALKRFHESPGTCYIVWCHMPSGTPNTTSSANISQIWNTTKSVFSMNIFAFLPQLFTLDLINPIHNHKPASMKIFHVLILISQARSQHHWIFCSTWWRRS